VGRGQGSELDPLGPESLIGNGPAALGASFSAINAKIQPRDTTMRGITSSRSRIFLLGAMVSGGGIKLRNGCCILFVGEFSPSPENGRLRLTTNKHM
jgi:hypothetical protein